MSNMVKAKVVSYGNGGLITKNNNFQHKLEITKSVVMLGAENIVKFTYWVYLTVKVPIGTEDNLDLDKFNIREQKGVFIKLPNDSTEKFHSLTELEEREIDYSELKIFITKTLTIK